jgi:hypothetical protein
MQTLLEAVRAIGQTKGPRLVALYGCMYSGMLRPSETAPLLLDERIQEFGTAPHGRLFRT